MTTVALVGLDGAGKSAVTLRLVSALGVPTAYIYMGVNLESSTLMLPTTRLALAVKRRRGGQPNLTGSFERRRVTKRHGPLAGVRSMLRLGNWMAEESFRQAVAWWHEARGRVVLFDRHFFCDYYATDIASRPDRSAASRLHGLFLDRVYPRPDLIVMLDVPPELAVARKGEDTVEGSTRRRDEYLALAGVVPRFAIVDAGQPIDDVVADVARLVQGLLAERGSRGSRTEGGGDRDGQPSDVPPTPEATR